MSNMSNATAEVVRITGSGKLRILAKGLTIEDARKFRDAQLARDAAELDMTVAEFSKLMRSTATAEGCLFIREPLT